MASQHTLRRLVNLTRPFTVPAASPSRGASSLGRSSCDSKTPPPCPPCVSAPPPPCRRAKAPSATGLQACCRPPHQGCRPPCAAAEPQCDMTCENRNLRAAETIRDDFGAQAEECGTTQNAVTRRLASAAAYRRAQYEQETAARIAAASVRVEQPQITAYQLGAERRCVRATDGREYVVACEEGAIKASPVPLEPDDKCQYRQTQATDPCALSPRVFLSVDRSSTREASPSNVPPAHIQQAAERPAPRETCVGPSPACNRQCAEYLPSKQSQKTPSSSPSRNKASVKELTSRIMQSLSLGRGCKPDEGQGRGAEFTRPACPKPNCRPGENKDLRVGNDRWCKSMPQLAAAPAKCREPTFVERLRSRPSGPTGRPQDDCGRRQFHSSARNNNTSADSKKDSKPAHGIDVATAVKDREKLKAMLAEREKLSAAGRGRELPSKECAPPKIVPPRIYNGYFSARLPAPSDESMHFELEVLPAPRVPPPKECPKIKCPPPCSSIANPSPITNIPASKPCNKATQASTPSEKAPQASTPCKNLQQAFKDAKNQACASKSSPAIQISSQTQAKETTKKETEQASSSKRDSWLSIKNLQKLAGARTSGRGTPPTASESFCRNASEIRMPKCVNSPKTVCDTSVKVTSPPSSKPNKPCGTSKPPEKKPK